MDLQKFKELILVEQTLFALPFAWVGILFAGNAGWIVWILVTIALAAARTAGMSFNRVIDADIDAKNPRTRDRLVPSGAAKKRDVWAIAIAASLILIGSSYMLNRLCFNLSFVAVALLFSYSYFKRFTASTHFYLGLVEAAAPIGGYLAVKGEWDPLPLLLGLSIMMWIAGFDIIYALLDHAFDKEAQLFSLPVRVGAERAVLISRIAYGLAVATLLALGFLTKRNVPYYVSVLCISLIMLRQHQLARTESLDENMREIFALNKCISPILLLGVAMDMYLA